ncbi:DUF2860 domain-containing protein [Vibrio crassostreae]|uniref:DUF2860 domain-containing protein n=1 Tax=Vibrio crassostreae TaxID=246167 RepID=UPI00104E8905|nr:DUF2860 domain-containing protein [Vibrio crassostreae]TCW20211.1 uncharacterized protein DUF2860 [Vibrio crassostreae]CAK3844387.1 conserved exported hypothetical protein [Vibrio crassostreae]
MKKLILTAIALSVSFAVNANELGEPGFSGEVSGLIGMTSETSNFNTDTKKKTGDLNTKGESESGLAAAPLGQIRYTFGSNNNHQVFAGTSREDVAVGDFVLELGYKHGFGENSSIAFSYLPSLGGETWADPFIVGDDREVTDFSSSAYRAKYDNILDSNFSADFAYYTIELDEESSGSFQTGSAIKSLDRNGDGVYSKISYTHQLSSNSMLEPSLLYKTFSADGDAMSNTEFGTELTYKAFYGRHAFALSGKYSSVNFDGTHAFFNKKQKDSKIGAFAAYEFDKLMGWENVSFNALAGYDVTTSNIEFYEKSELIIGVGATYKF